MLSQKSRRGFLIFLNKVLFFLNFDQKEPKKWFFGKNWPFWHFLVKFFSPHFILLTQNADSMHSSSFYVCIPGIWLDLYSSW